MQAVELALAKSRRRILATVGYIGILALVSVASIAFAWTRVGIPDTEGAAGYEVVVVQPGDTLWSIARSLSREGADIRRMVYEIRAINGLGVATIHPGQQLLVPID